MGKGMGGHQSARAKTETWLTPRHILDALGEFDMDPCSAPDPEFWPTAHEHYTWPKQDGLILPWRGRIWLNPPYGNAMSKWMAKLASHGRGSALIFARTETAGFFSHVWEEADALLFLKGRLHFHHADGTRSEQNAGAPSVLCAFGKEDAEKLIESNLDGHIVALKRPVMLYLSLEHRPPAPTWRQIVHEALRSLGGEAALQELYTALQEHPRVKASRYAREKIRQTVGRMGLERTDEGTYALAI